MIQKGENVFYTDNSAGSKEYFHVAYRIISSLDLVPFCYSGIDLKTRGSSLDKEIRDDFYASKVVTILSGAGPQWRDVFDNWVIPELSIAEAHGMKILSYAMTPVSEEEPLRVTSDSPALVENIEDFETILRRDLQDLLGL